MTASVEYLCGCKGAFLVRVHAEGDGLGAPYSWCCTVAADGDNPGVAVVGGVLRAPLPSEYRAACAAIRGAGFGAVRWERRRGGRVEEWGREL